MIPESQNIEFKESWRDEYQKWICGFANAQGGVLYVGVKDDGEVCGVQDAKKLMEDIPNKVRDMMGILVDVNLKEKDGKSYLEIVTEAYPYPVSFRGKYYQRSGATNQELKGAALDRFMLRKQGKTWDGVPVPYLKAEDLDNATFDLFRKYAKRSGRMEEADLMDDNHGLLEKLRLYEGSYLKRAAALLFHPDPEKYVTGAFVKVGFFREGMDLVYQDEVHGNLFQQIAKLMDLLCTKYMKAIITYEGIQRIETLPIPREALREALLNACINKDYAEPSPIQIRVYENKLEIINGGVLPEGWTVETLLSSHRSMPYNPDIANTFFRAGEIEAWGRGIERIITACKNDGFSTPEFRYDASGIWTTFKFEYPERATAQNGQNTTQKTVQKTMQKTIQKLTEQQQAILAYLNEHPNATRKELCEKIPDATMGGIIHNLSRLQELGLLKRVGGRKQGYWQVTA
ncbi:MAG TPA: putative DNA binding domain-containing protein [Candidatus Bacteroides pullicola]|uniref:DNA binding domain-containing protein n=1 Tax=Candidatus Bacteroides pullicola TaxID=2838475 RepID=A0A9D1ZIV4_9BACE|nr:putative DNA binding domain-containing protein [Candidatus Bacteroides pullicola]